MAKTPMTEEEKQKRKEEREAQKEKQLKENEKKIKMFRECDYINTLSDDLILGFINKMDNDYSDLTLEKAVELLFKRFVDGEIQFAVRKEYY